MNKNLTEIVIVSDRSGSMGDTEAKRLGAEGGINFFIEEQKKGVGECKLTFIQFDDSYEILHDGIPIKDVPRYSLRPRYNTAYYKALTIAIKTVGERLHNTSENERPGLVIFLISTDGLENASGSDYPASVLKELVQHQQDVYKWVFNFIGAGIDAIKAGAEIGISSATSASTGENKTGKGYELTSGKVKLMRQMLNEGEGEAQIRSAGMYSDEEREEMK